MKKVLVVLMLINFIAWTPIQRYMMKPNSITNDRWGFNTMIA